MKCVLALIPGRNVAFRVHKLPSILGQSQAWIDVQGFCQEGPLVSTVGQEISSVTPRTEDRCDQDGFSSSSEACCHHWPSRRMCMS